MIYVFSVIIVISVALLCLFQNRFYRIPKRKVLIAVLLMVVAGVVGVKLLCFVETGNFFGASFYGSIFCVPFVLYVAARPMKVPREILFDFSGPVFAVFLAIIKLWCLCLGCCAGFAISVAEDNTVLRFPSALVESICGLIICVILLLMQKNPKNRGCLCPAFLVIYGTNRFMLNFFRADLGTFRLLKWTGLTIPPGHLWSVVCIVWGIIWLYRFRSRACGRKLTFKEFAKSIFGLHPVEVGA